MIQGVNEGDPLADASDSAYEDVYTLAGSRTPRAPRPRPRPDQRRFRVAADSGTGTPGARVFLDSLLTFMGPAGGTREALVFVEVDRDRTIAEIYLCPLAPFAPKQGYISGHHRPRRVPRARLAETAAVAFTRGTRITLAERRPAADRGAAARRPGADPRLGPADPALDRARRPSRQRRLRAGHHRRRCAATTPAGSWSVRATGCSSPAHRRAAGWPQGGAGARRRRW